MRGDEKKERQNPATLGAEDSAVPRIRASIAIQLDASRHAVVFGQPHCNAHAFYHILTDP